MFKRFLFVLALCGFTGSPASLLAAPPPVGSKTDSGPALLLQVQSVNDIVAKVKKSFENILSPEMLKEFEKNEMGFLFSEKTLEGMDRTKPSLFYALVDPSILKGDFSKLQAVVLLPVTDLKKFSALLEKAKIELVEDKEKGYFNVRVPSIPVPLFLKMHQGYAYISIASASPLDSNAMVSVKDLVDAKETAALTLKVFPDRVAKELRSLALDGLESFMQSLMTPELNDTQKKLMESYIKFLSRRYRMAIEEGKEIAYRIDLDPKNGEFIADMSIEGKPKTPLVSSIAGIKKTQNAFASLVTKDSVVYGVFSPPLYIEDLRDLSVGFVKMIQEEVSHGGNAPAEAMELGAVALKTLETTLQSGQMDVAATLNGPNKEGLYNAVGVAQWKDARQVEKALRKVVPIIPEGKQKLIKLDAKKIGTITVHEVDLSEEFPNEEKNIFGKEPKLAIAFDDDRVFIAFGSDTTTQLEMAAKAKPGPASIIELTASGKKMEGLIKKAMPDKKDGAATGWLGIFSKSESHSLLKYNMEGGDKFQMTVRYGFFPFIGLFGARSSAAFEQIQAKPVQIKE